MENLKCAEFCDLESLQIGKLENKKIQLISNVSLIFILNVRNRFLRLSINFVKIRVACVHIIY